MAFFDVLLATLRIPKARLYFILFVLLNVGSYFLPQFIPDMQALKNVSFLVSLPSLFFLLQFIRYFYTVRVQRLKQEEECDKKRR